MTRRATAAISLTLLIAGVVRGEGPATAPATDAALERRLVEIDRVAAKVEDLSGDFTQSKITPLLRKPLVSAGTIRVRGAVMLWDTRSPEPTRMRIDPGEIRLYYPRQETVEVFPIDRQLGSLAASPLPRLDVLRKYFSFEKTPISALGADVRGDDLLALRLTPTDAALREHLEQVVVLLDAKQGLILRAEMTDADGDRTQIVFSNIRVNTGLREADVALNAPASAKVTRPLDGLGGSPPARDAGGRDRSQGK